MSFINIKDFNNRKNFNSLELSKIISKLLYIKYLNNKDVQSIKKQLCEQFTERKQKKDCIVAFDKSFIKSFISSRQIMSWMV